METTLTKEMFNDILNLPLDQFTTHAKDRGACGVRVVTENGKSRIVTMDLRPSRVNVAVITRDGVKIVNSVSGFY